MSVVEEDVGDGGSEGVSGEDEVATRAAEQRRIEDEFASAARERAKIQEQAAKLLDAAQRIEARQSRPEPEPDDSPPKRDDFDTYEGYLEATLKSQKMDVQRYVDSQVQAALAMHRESVSADSVRARMQESARRGEEAYPGFSDIIAKVPALPQAALSAWQELEEPEHVAHYLGAHPEEARKIGGMTSGRAAHAVIALGERLDQQRSNGKAAPEFGPKPGGKAASGGLTADMSMESYAKARIQEKLKQQT